MTKIWDTWKKIESVVWLTFDSDYTCKNREWIRQMPEKIDWPRCIPFIILHIGLVGLFFVGWSWAAVLTAVFFYFFRMFAVTGIYHRYFSHRAYKVNRFVQFLFAIWGGTATQRGPLWWAAHHRHHHQYSDTDEDIHSPSLKGFLWAHIGWMTCRKYFPTNYDVVKDFTKYPEIVFLNRYDTAVPILFATSMVFWGAFLEHFFPQLHTSGAQMLVWGFFVSTVALFHGTCCINSMAHIMGKPRYKSGDESKNSFILALITLGEGWHNNHHQYKNCARQGFYWWELDITYYILKFFSLVGIIHSLRPVPEEAYDPNHPQRLSNSH